MIKTLFCLWTIVLFSVSLTIGQKKVMPTVPKTGPFSKLAEAEKAWSPFWNRFCEIVKNNDRKELREIMTPDFQGRYSGPRDEQLKWFDRTNPNYNQDWETLGGLGQISGLLRKGELVGGVGAIKNTPSRIVANKWYVGKKKSACQSSKNDHNNCGWNIAIFEFRNGKWFLIELTYCECE